MTDAERLVVSTYRRLRGFPKHSPPHFDVESERQYLLTAACYEHKHIIGKSHERMTECEAQILSICEKFSSAIYTWCILPNHYHVLLKSEQIKSLLKEIGLFHGRSSYEWNGEENCRGRHVWHNCLERKIRTERHFYASLNYVLNNPVLMDMLNDGKTGNGPMPSNI